VVAIERIYCEFKSCYRFVVFLLFFYLMPTSGLRVGLSLTVGYNTYSQSHPVCGLNRTVVSVAVVITVFAGLLFVEKPTGFKLVKKLPAFYGPRRFVTACTSARRLSLP
jgi:hypothetical protein